MNLLQRIARSNSPKLERPFRALSGYLLQNAGLSERFHLRRSQYAVPFFARSNVALTLWVNPSVVDPAEEFVYDFLKPGDTFVDVGANIGCVTAAGALATGHGGRVLAIEAHPRTFQYLRKTVAVNHFQNVTMLNVAVGAEKGVLRFSDEKRKDDNNCVSPDQSRGLEVPCVPLGDILQEHQIDRISLLKIDVEGFEMQVLRGAGATLDRVDCLYVEVLEHTLARFGSSSKELISFLKARGFRCFRFRNDDSNVVAFSPRVSIARWQDEILPA